MTSQLKKLALILALTTTASQATDWPQWRGPQSNNHAPKDAAPVTEWSAEKNIRWKTPIPGRGHSTPIIVNGKIYLTTGDLAKKTQSLIALDRKTGKIDWEKTIHTGGYPGKQHRENSPASQTAQWDGTNIIVIFQNDDKIKATAVSPAGEVVWTKTVSDYKPSYEFGYGSTPVIHKETLIVVVGTAKNGKIMAIKTKDGTPVWSTPRAGHDYWCTPVIATVSGKEQLLVTGTGKFSSYNPDTGKLNWEAPLAPQSTCGTVVWTEDMIFASGGFPKNETAGVKADGTSTVAWSNRERCYEQSLLSYRDHIYAVTDKGFAHCWDAKTGEEKWKERIGRGGVMASPLAVGDHIYAGLKDGSTVIFKATGESYQEVAKNQLDTDLYATPVAIDQDLFLRTGKTFRGTRQEHLYCIGKK